MLKFNKLFMILLSLGSVLFLTTSCSKEGGKGISRTTGWAYNDPKNGDFQVTPSREQKTGPGLVFIEGGTFTMGATEETPFYEWDNRPHQVTVNSFYMDETEVSNLDYLEYIHWLKRVYGADYPNVVRKALPDTTVWLNKMTYNEPLVENYFRHPAYHDYPVVGVSWLQANNYASWRTDRVNEQLLINAGYLDYNPHQKDDNSFNTEAYLSGQYRGEGKKNAPRKGWFGKRSKKDTVDQSGVRTARYDDGILLPHYRLPTEAEWEYAALGLVGNTVNNRIVERKTYPWNGEGLRSDDKKYYGSFVANFKINKGDYMGVAGDLNDGASIPAPVFSYWPNDFGLYNMAGNVSEWVLDRYSPTSFDAESDFDPYYGDNFKTFKRDADGKIAPKDSLGRVPLVPLSKGKLAQMQNTTPPPDNFNMSEMKRKGFAEYGVTSLINSKSRVIKGGSWNDPPYYLSPGTRRYLDEDKSSATVGFRCAMSRVGNPESVRTVKKK
jgi:sulfatase modifying factor 1